MRTGVVSCGCCARTWAALMSGTDATAFECPLGQAGGKSGIGLDSLEFWEHPKEPPLKGGS